MINKKNFPGMDGFVWFTGIVENRNDPLKLGRVQIRIFGWHTDNTQLIESENLLWAQPTFGINTHQITHVPKEGEMVFGFFMDGEHGQFPFVIGVIPAIPETQPPNNKGFADPGNNIEERPITLHSGQTRYPGSGELNQPTTSRSARNENMDQTPYKVPHTGKYPYVFSLQSESGHYIDLDDTPGSERITIIHRTGSKFEIQPDGTILIYSIKDIDMIAQKNVNITAVTGNITEKARNNISETAGSNITENAGKITQTAGSIIDDTSLHTTTGIHKDSIGKHV